MDYSSVVRAALGQDLTACLTESASPAGTSSTLMCSTSSSSTSKTSGTSPAQTALASQASRSTSTFTAGPPSHDSKTTVPTLCPRLVLVICARPVRVPGQEPVLTASRTSARQTVLMT